MNFNIRNRRTGSSLSLKLPPHMSNQFQDLLLPNPQFHASWNIDGILGAELFPHVYLRSSRSIGPGQLTGISTLFEPVFVLLILCLSNTVYSKVYFLNALKRVDASIKP